MRIGVRLLALLVPVIALAVAGSLRVMDSMEHRWLSSDLSRRSALISESIHDSLVDGLKAGRTRAIVKMLNRISLDERLMGALVCSPQGALLAKSDAVPDRVTCVPPAELPNWATAKFIQTGQPGKSNLHEAVFSVRDDDGKSVAELILLHDTSYMRQRHATAEKYIFGMLGALSLLFVGMSLALHRWSMRASLSTLRGVFRGLVSGDLNAIDQSVTRGELSPIARDLSKVMRELRNAKSLVKEAESGLAWTPSRLRAEVQRYFGESQLCVIANREPYIHNKKGGKIEVQLPASGLVTAVEPIVRACSGLWIAHGSGSGDRATADSSGKLLVPPGHPEYVLKRVWLTKVEEQGYYYGFSNEGLWPLCHIAHARPHFDSEDYRAYREVNAKFAKGFAEEQTEGRPVILIQDYHFALLPKMIREKRPDALISLFWHIPWPNPEAFGICPWKKDLLEGMLGADLIGFHTQFHCNNFLDTVDRFLEARVDRENFSVTIQGHVCYVKPFAISVEWPPRYDLPVDAFAQEREELLAELNLPKGIKLGLGVDRVDYTKGMIERFQSIERFLELHPEWVGKFCFIQIGAPSRTHIKRYQDLNSEVQELADRINWRFQKSDIPPILLKLSHHNSPELYRYYRAADVCFVSSLHDGMNLVAKEYVAARSDNGGALILSNFTGASRELTDALLVNPYDLDECANALYHGITMLDEERRQRMSRLRSVVSERNVYAWAGSLLAEMHRIALSKSEPGTAATGTTSR